MRVMPDTFLREKGGRKREHVLREISRSRASPSFLGSVGIWPFKLVTPSNAKGKIQVAAGVAYFLLTIWLLFGISSLPPMLEYHFVIPRISRFRFLLLKLKGIQSNRDINQIWRDSISSSRTSYSLPARAGICRIACTFRHLITLIVVMARAKED